MAILSSTLGIANYLFKEDNDSTANDEDGHEALHLAALNGNLDAAKFLPEKATHRTDNPEKINFLQAISSGKDLDTIRSLYHDESDLTTTDVDGNTALHLATWSAKEDVLKFLLEKGADRKAVNNKKCTAFQQAITNGRNLTTIKLLYNDKSDLTTKDLDGNTALHLAAWFGKEDILKFLLENGADRKAFGPRKLIPFQTAIIERRALNIAKLLFEDESDLTTRDENGNTALHLAASQGKEDVLSFLIEKGADRKALNNIIRTPFYRAIATGRDLNIVQLLYHDTSDLTTQDIHGYTALHLAALEGNEDVVHFLLEKGANRKALSNEAFTPFLFAVAGSGIKVVELLYLDEYDLSESDEFGNTALVYASFRETRDILDFIEEKMEMKHFDVQTFSKIVDFLRYISVGFLILTLSVYILLPEIRSVPGLITICYIVAIATRLSLEPLVITMFDVKKDLRGFLDEKNENTEEPSPLCIALGKNVYIFQTHKIIS